MTFEEWWGEHGTGGGWKQVCASAWAAGRESLRIELAQRPEARTIPEGWQLVPIEPTEEMLQAMERGAPANDKAAELARTWREYERLDWQYVLSVAPEFMNNGGHSE